MQKDSKQGDKQIERIISLYEHRLSSSIQIDVSDTPDIVPAIALRAAAADIDTDIINAGRLRYKESDRLASISKILTQLGADVMEGSDNLRIKGSCGRLLKGSDEVISVESDHRMVMLAAFASIICEKPVIIDEPEAVRKSYPTFFDDIVMLGGRVEE